MEAESSSLTGPETVKSLGHSLTLRFDGQADYHKRLSGRIEGSNVFLTFLFRNHMPEVIDKSCSQFFSLKWVQKEAILAGDHSSLTR